MHRFFSYFFLFLKILSRYFTRETPAYASYITLSIVFAFLPFALCAGAVSQYMGVSHSVEKSSVWFFCIFPPSVVDPFFHDISQAFCLKHSSLFTVTFFTTAYFASSGIEALRTALHYAYNQTPKRGFLRRRAQSLLFVFIGSLALCVIGFFLFSAPLPVMHALAPFASTVMRLRAFYVWPYGVALTLIGAALLAVHKWLPDGERSIQEILPGVIATLFLWVVVSVFFSKYLAHYAPYKAPYKHFSSLIGSLVFIDLLSLFFLLGGYLNAALKEHRSRT